MNIARKIARYGYRRDTLDRRDLLLAPQLVLAPAAVSLRDHLPPAMDQGQLGSCTGHGSTGAMRTVLKRAGVGDVPLSRLQAYYDARRYEGTINSDAGAEIRDVIRGIAWLGVAPEALWPYDESKVFVRPSAEAYAAALRYEIEYQRVGGLDGTAKAGDVKMALAAGHPVVFGFNVFNQFESDACAQTGVITMPADNEQPIGGHCVFLWGYGQKPGYFSARNSWGQNWGDNGDFYLPEAFVEQQGSDFWAITKVKPA